jgi:prepilin-type N-terminal cleavage/methylation domain-containing protein
MKQGKRSVSGRVGAFTLIELLVVISIISLLVAILLPALAAARQAAQIVQSLTNARQLSFCVLTYSEDFRSYLPHARFMTAAEISTAISTNTPDSTPAGVAYGNKLLSGKYLNSAKVFWSPTRDASRVRFDNIRTNPDHPDVLNSGFAINSHSVGPIQTWPFNATLRMGLGSNPQPSRHLFLLEMWRVNQYPAPLTPGIDGWYAAGTTNVNNAVFTLNGNAVSSYLDGRAINGPARDLGWNATGFRQGAFLNSSSFTYAGAAPWYQ